LGDFYVASYSIASTKLKKDGLTGFLTNIVIAGQRTFLRKVFFHAQVLMAHRNFII
jgi:hypothetical protein